VTRTQRRSLLGAIEVVYLGYGRSSSRVIASHQAITFMSRAGLVAEIAHDRMRIATLTQAGVEFFEGEGRTEG
jgi:hypothetical protein